MGCCESSTKGRPKQAVDSTEVHGKDDDNVDEHHMHQTDTSYPSGKVKCAKAPETWPWTRPKLDEKKVGGRCKRAGDYFYTKEYLNSFRILSAVEAQAYEAYQNNDEPLARRILNSQKTDIGASNGLLYSPNTDATLSPEDIVLSPVNKKEVERVRGGSLAGNVVKSHALEDKDADKPESAPKSPRTTQRLLYAVKKCPLFSHLSINFLEHEVVVAGMERVEFKRREVILRAGEFPPEHRRGWYVVAEGKVKWTSQVGSDVRSPGESFGELLVTNVTTKSAIDVETDPTQPTVCYYLSHASYSTMLSRIAHRRRQTYKKELKKVKVGNTSPFGNMKSRELAQLADCLTERLFPPGEMLLNYGEQGTCAYFILKGTVEVIGRDKNGNPFRVCEFSQGEDPVGFLEFFDGTVANNIADVRAKSNGRGVVTACITREHFERCMGPAKDLLKNAADTSHVYDYYRNKKKT